MGHLRTLLLIVAGWLVACSTCIAQADAPTTGRAVQARMDSLLRQLRVQREDTNKVLTLLALADLPVAAPKAVPVSNRTVHAEYIPTALDLSRKLGWKRGEVLAIFLSSIESEQNADKVAARSRLDEAIRLSPVLEPHERGEVLQRGALFYAVNELDLDLADSLVKASLACFDERTAPLQLAASLEVQARVLLFKQDWVPAIVAYYRAIDFGEKHHAWQTLAIAYEKTAMIMDQLGDVDKACQYYGRSTRLSDSLGFHFRAYMGYSNLARTLNENGRAGEALAAARKATAIARVIALPVDYAGSSTLEEARARLALGGADHAAALLDSITRKGLPAEEIQFMLLRGQIALKRRQWQEAMRQCRGALPGGARHYDHLRQEKQACDCLMRAYQGAGAAGEALKWSMRAQQLADTLHDMASANAVTRMAADREYGKRMLSDSLAHVAETSRIEAEALYAVNKERTRRNFMIIFSLCLLAVALVILRQRMRIAKEKKRSEELLLNILPAEVAEELKNTGSSEARHIEQATILFTDFKGFTELSEVLTPQELVAELDTCFKAFDAIITARGIEKIKTIGDAYMAAGGLTRDRHSSVADVVGAALDMQEFIQGRKAGREAQGLPAFEMRIGIHTGPVVAGIVGVKKFQYDIWGDTVNTASRMESSGEVGRVNISASTYREVLARPGWVFTPRGKVQAKGKGELEMYFVERNRNGTHEQDETIA
ncbi:MAG: hypothetical protein JST38_09355 [Bacteroidetes bacterium]|nr:hypothetical protein [Bacteroidota bacterium]MBS1941070.1 hypothetical protein [Bacteroidota bacterium]